MDFYCNADKLRKTISQSLLLFTKWEGSRRIRDERQKDRRAANPSTPSPPLSSMKTALVLRSLLRDRMGVPMTNSRWTSKLLHCEVPPNACGIIFYCVYSPRCGRDSTLPEVIIRHLTTAFLIRQAGREA